MNSHQGGPFGPYPQQGSPHPGLPPGHHSGPPPGYQGGWAPQHPYQPPFPQPTSPRRRRRRKLVVAATVLALLVAGGVATVWGVTATGDKSDKAVVNEAVDAYTQAIARGDVNALRNATCDVDADQFGEYGVQGGVATLRPTPTVKDIRMKGDDAAVTISTTTAPDTTVYFRKQNEAWKACPSAVASFPKETP